MNESRQILETSHTAKPIYEVESEQTSADNGIHTPMGGTAVTEPLHTHTVFLALKILVSHNTSRSCEGANERTKRRRKAKGRRWLPLVIE